MVEILSTAGCSSEIEKLIKNAKDKLYLISPFMNINDQIKSHLVQLDNRVSTITIKVVGKTDEVKVDEIAFLQTLKSAQILCVNHLHAKCYMNEDVAVITSLNLYEFSQQNNVELGVKIDRIKEPEIYAEVYKEVSNIISQSKKYELKLVPKESPKVFKEPIKISQSTKAIEKGFCIRCGRDIDVNLDKPLCNTCYQSWAKYSDPAHQEKYCHVCGKESKQSYSKPICYNCYKTMKK